MVHESERFGFQLNNTRRFRIPSCFPVPFLTLLEHFWAVIQPKQDLIFYNVHATSSRLWRFWSICFRLHRLNRTIFCILFTLPPAFLVQSGLLKYIVGEEKQTDLTKRKAAEVHFGEASRYPVLFLTLLEHWIMVRWARYEHIRYNLRDTQCRF